MASHPAPDGDYLLATPSTSGDAQHALEQALTAQFGDMVLSAGEICVSTLTSQADIILSHAMPALPACYVHLCWPIA